MRTDLRITSLPLGEKPLGNVTAQEEEEAASLLIQAAFRYLEIKALRRELSNRVCPRCAAPFEAPGVDMMVGYDEGGSVLTLGIVHPRCADMMDAENPAERISFERGQ